MKVLVDENIPAMTAQALREAGHDVRDVRGTSGQGMPDQALWHLAQAEERLLITTDKGFTKHRDEPHSGVLVIRLRRPNRLKIHRRVLHGLAQLDAVGWRGVLVIMRDTAMSTWRASDATR